MPPIPAQPTLNLGRVALNPTADCRVIDRDTALTQHRLKIPIAHAVSEIPADCPKDDLAAMMPAFEILNSLTSITPIARQSDGPGYFATEPFIIHHNSNA